MTSPVVAAVARAHLPALPPPRPAPDLFASDPAGLAALSRLVDELTRAAVGGLRRRSGPLPAATPAALSEKSAATITAAASDGGEGGVLPRRGAGVTALWQLARWYAEDTVDLTDTAAVAHLQPPPLTIAVAADVLASAFNASVDTWDSGPAAVELERHVVAALTRLAGYGPASGGVLTSGGTASNLHALLLARDAAGERLGHDVAAEGWPAGVRPAVFCSAAAHFSVSLACRVLGLGEHAVVPVPVDGAWQMRPDALAAALAATGPDQVPVAVVATAGTTDFGSVDPLPRIAAITQATGVRLHVDAAYGGGALFSDRLRPLLAGLAEADSITMDLHKTGWQPAAASVLLVRDADDLTAGARRVAYLNPDDDGEAGYDGLLSGSLQTTRRADALKIAAAFLAFGQDGLAALVEGCHALADHAATRIDAQPRLELTSRGALTTVVFRYLPPGGTADPARCDRVNAGLRRRLMRAGTALVGRTTLPSRDGTTGPGQLRLKLTLLNPQASPHDIDAILDAVVRAGDEEAAS